MRQFSLSGLFLVLSAFMAFAYAQDVYTTIYTTSTKTRTVYLVKTETATGVAPTSVSNSTSTYLSTGTGSVIVPTSSANVSQISSAASPSSSATFPGAGSNVHVPQVLLVGVLAGLGLLAL